MRDEQKELLLAITGEITKIRGKEDLLRILNETLKRYIQHDEGFIFRYDRHDQTCSVFVSNAESARLKDHELNGGFPIDYFIEDDIFDINVPVVRNIESLFNEGRPPIKSFFDSGYRKFVKVKLIDRNDSKTYLVFLSKHKQSFKLENLQLLQKVCYLISLATANIVANEEIAEREEEKTILLSLSNEIAALRNRRDLFTIVNTRLKTLLSVREFGIAQIDQGNETYSAFIVDLEEDTTNDPEFEKITSQHYKVSDTVFTRIARSNEPVVFDVTNLAREAEIPAYVLFWQKIGVEKIVGIALRAGGEMIGCVFLHVDHYSSKRLKKGLLKGVCAFLSVAVSNILANEEIVRRESERELLLSLNMDIAAVRNNEELLQVIEHRLKKLLSFTHTLIGIINDDGKSVSAFLLDPKSRSKNHPSYEEARKTDFPIQDGVLNIALQTPSPVIINLDELQENQELPLYLKINYEFGIKQIAVIRFSKGQEPFGFWMIFFDQKMRFDSGKLNLIEGLANQMSIAVSNIIASKNIQRREEEKSRLLDFSNAIASVRDKVILSKILEKQLKELLAIEDYAIHALSDDKKTQRPLLYDPDAEFSKHPEFQLLVNQQTDINDGIFNTILNSEDPVTFDAENWVNLEKPPVYANAAREIGIKKLTGLRVRLGNENIAVWNFRHDGTNLTREHFPLLKSICSQIAIAVSNIIAHDDILGREQEKSKLLEFSNEIASVRDKMVLSKILRQQLFKLFNIEDYLISELTNDKKSFIPLLYDPEADFIKDPLFEKLLNTPFDVNDGVFDKILSSEAPVTFRVEEWSAWKNPPVYLETAKKIGLKRMTGVRIRMGDEDIAVMNFRHDHFDLTPDQSNLLKSICSQIAIAVSNIIADQKIINQLTEINNYKLQLEEEKIYLKEELETSHNYSEIIGESTEMKKVFRLVEQVAPSDSTVIILGETGTGKELIARAIHNSSPRKNRLMVKVNCATLPANLIESELFGHERGSFTGATERRIGKFELADQGTLFLDEVGEMPLDLQVKLLRALQEREIERVGGKTPIKVNVRIIAATNRELEKLMEEGKFRSDLYYRLNIFPVRLPPLRERREDIPALASYFIHRYSKKAGKKISALSKKALEELVHYSWPGNIRELEHLIERSLLLATGDTIKEIYLPAPREGSIAHVTQGLIIKSIHENERDYILQILQHVKGRITGKGGAAELLGVPPSTLTSKIKKLGIRKEYLR